jgi:hypothetical protein
MDLSTGRPHTAVAVGQFSRMQGQWDNAIVQDNV